MISCFQNTSSLSGTVVHLGCVHCASAPLAQYLSNIRFRTSGRSAVTDDNMLSLHVVWTRKPWVSAGSPGDHCLVRPLTEFRRTRDGSCEIT